MTSVRLSEVAIAERLVREVMVYIVDHGSIHLGTPETAKLQKAGYLLRGEDVPKTVEARLNHG